jgi:hypothetical protein
MREVAEVDQQEPEVEPDRLRMGKKPRQRAEARERRGGPVLVVAADGGGREGFGVVGCGTRSRGEFALGGDRAERLLEGRAT